MNVIAGLIENGRRTFGAAIAAALASPVRAQDFADLESAAGVSVSAIASIILISALIVVVFALWRRLRDVRARLRSLKRRLDDERRAPSEPLGDAPSNALAEAMADGGDPDAALIRSMIEALPLGYARFDAAGRLVRSAASLVRQSGAPSEAGEGRGPGFDEKSRDPVFGQGPEAAWEAPDAWRARLSAAAAHGGFQRCAGTNGRPIARLDRLSADGGLVSVWLDLDDILGEGRSADGERAGGGDVEEPGDHAAQRPPTTVSLTPVGAWSYERASRVVTLDSIARSLFGVGEEFEPSIENIPRFCAPASRNDLQRAVRVAVDEALDFECEIEIVKRDGDRVWARVVGVPETKDGEVVRLSGGIQDITLLKRQCEALRIANQELLDVMEDLNKAEKRFFDIAAVSNDWFWETDVDGRFVYISDSFERVTGFDPMKMIGRTRIEMLGAHPDSRRSADWAWLERKLAAREPFHDFVYLNFSFRESNPIWVRTSGAPHLDSNGEFAGYRGIGSNVTTLYSALRRAEEANAAKTAFLATMSHEIRTPMNGVLGLAEELQSRAQGPEERKIAASIHESGVHLLTVINDILDVSKIEAGELVLEEAPFDLDELSTRIIAVHASRAAEKGLELRRTPGPKAGAWRGDPHRVMQIVHNLVSNAVKFTEEGVVEISVASDPAGGFAITVADSGIGMTEEQVAHVFDWFRQGDASTTRRYGGTGLGMSIVHDLTEAMGGRVEIESAPGDGATFTVFLPLPPAKSPPAPAPKPTAPAPRRGLRVLAVDDNATNRMLLDLILAKAEMDVRMVESGAEAVAEAASAIRDGRAFDIILMDIAMPEMDGVETLQAIRADEALHGRRTPALAVTANVLSHQVAEYLSLGFDGHVPKPIQRDALMEGIRLAVSAAEPRAAE